MCGCNSLQKETSRADSQGNQRDVVMQKEGTLTLALLQLVEVFQAVLNPSIGLASSTLMPGLVSGGLINCRISFLDCLQSVSTNISLRSILITPRRKQCIHQCTCCVRHTGLPCVMCAYTVQGLDWHRIRDLLGQQMNTWQAHASSIIMQNEMSTPQTTCTTFGNLC